MASRFADMTLGSIVAEDYRAAAVLDRYGIDFCCSGKRTLEEACSAKGCKPAVVVAELECASGAAAEAQSDNAWETADLVTHIVTTHHGYVRHAVPRIASYLDKLVTVHGARHPELARVAQHFEELSNELLMHMYKEEEILFPYVRSLAAIEAGAPAPPNVFGTVRNPIRMMEAEHAGAGQELAMIRELTSDFHVPADGCATYSVCYKELEAFDADLRRHIHLENNVLFPKAIALERAAGLNGVD